MVNNWIGSTPTALHEKKPDHNGCRTSMDVGVSWGPPLGMGPQRATIYFPRSTAGEVWWGLVQHGRKRWGTNKHRSLGIEQTTQLPIDWRQISLDFMMFLENNKLGHFLWEKFEWILNQWNGEKPWWKTKPHWKTLGLACRIVFCMPIEEVTLLVDQCRCSWEN